MENTQLEEDIEEEPESANTRRSIHNKSSIPFSYRFPFTNKDFRLGPIIVGSAALILSGALIPLFAFLGYIVKICNYSAVGKNASPKFNNFKKLTKEGIKMMPVISYLIVLHILLDFGVEFMSLDNSLVGYLPVALPIYLFPAVLVVYSVEKEHNILNYILKSLKFAFSFNYIFGFLVFSFYLIMATIGGVAITVISMGLALVVFLTLYFYSISCFWGHRYYLWEKSTHQDSQQ